MSAETFLLLTVLAHRARSGFFLQLTRYITYLLTYLPEVTSGASNDIGL